MSTNKLEQALQAAASDAGRRADFYRTLLESEIFTLGKADRDAEGLAIRLHIQPWQQPDGSEILPFFTSLEQLRLSIEDEQAYLKLNARDLFEATRGAQLVLNTNADYGKVFTPAEVEALLDGSLLGGAQARQVPEGRRILLGQPADYPEELVQSLRALFGGLPAVRAAYLALKIEAGEEAAESLLIGLEVEGEEAAYRQVLEQMAPVMQASDLGGRPVDLMRLDGSGLAQQLRDGSEAFYRAEG